MKKDTNTRTPGANRGLGWGAGRVAFLARADQIRDLLAAGHPMTTVYEMLRDNLSGLSYEGFRYHVNRQRVDHARASRLAAVDQATPERAPAAPKPAAMSPPAAAPVAATVGPDKPRVSDSDQVGRKFKYDPTPRDFS